MYESSECWFITTRCFQARKLMTPRTPLVREVCGGVLARAAELYGVKVYAYVFMSNHLHLVVGARGLVVADFVKYLLGNLSRKLAPLCTKRWWGKFWERRASVAPILDEAALEDRVRYVLAHGPSPGSVGHKGGLRSTASASRRAWSPGATTPSGARSSNSS
jgi:REP element-mobilizing transposase RayT